MQRDLLPIVEGASVSSRYGLIRTEHILFIAAGAFHMSKPSDLLPELQGRFPIRVELQDLTEEDFRRILTAPKNALTKQYAALLGTEGVTLDFTEDGLAALARIAATANSRSQNIGARRLHTVMEKLLEDVSFEATDLENKHIVIDAKMVEERLKADLGRRRFGKVHPLIAKVVPPPSRRHVSDTCRRNGGDTMNDYIKRNSGNRPWKTTPIAQHPIHPPAPHGSSVR